VVRVQVSNATGHLFYYLGDINSNAGPSAIPYKLSKKNLYSARFLNKPHNIPSDTESISVDLLHGFNHTQASDGVKDTDDKAKDLQMCP